MSRQSSPDHVVDDRHRASSPVAARLFRREYQPKVPENRQLDLYTARYRHHPCRIEPSRGDKHLTL